MFGQTEQRLVGLLVILCILLIDYSSCSPSMSTLLWSDEFNNTGLPNSSLWTMQQGGDGWYNNELQYYTNSTRNAQVSGGKLVITSIKEAYGGCNYTSARMISKRTFRYGYFEMRAILPQGRGVWPAFWLLSKTGVWPAGGEIDIFENVGYIPTYLQASIQCNAYYWRTPTQMFGSTSIVNNNATYHTYALDWNTNRLKFYVDDKMYFNYTKPSNWTIDTWPFDGDFNIIINNAIGGSWGGLKGVNDSIFPTYYTIDYVRQFASLN